MRTRYTGSAPLFFLLFVARFNFEPDRRTDELEAVADLVSQKALVAEVQLNIAVGEEDERRRRNRSLSHVINADALVHGHRSPLEVDLIEEAVHLARSDALAALARNKLDFFEEGIHAFVFRGSDEDQRRVVKVLEGVADLLLVDLLVGGWLAVEEAHAVGTDFRSSSPTC